MKKLLFILMAAGSMNLAIAQSSRETPYMTKSLIQETVSSARMETSGGNISIKGGNASQARLEVYARGSYRDEVLSTEEIKKRLDDSYEFEVSIKDGNLLAIARPKEHNMNWRRGLSISFVLYTGPSLKTHLRTSGGNIDLTNLGGIQDFETSGGNLDLDNLSGKVTGVTSGGNVTILRSRDEINLSTSGGNAEANDCQGNIKLVTSGGNVQGEGIAGELSASTSGGNVRFKNLSCSLDASTSGGNMDVDMQALGKYVRLSNSGGDIALKVPRNKGLDLDLRADKINLGTLENFSGKVKDNEVFGKLNGGGVPITVDGGGGKLSLRFN